MALITDLPESTTISGTDLFVKDTGSATQKITAANLIYPNLIYTKKVRYTESRTFVSQQTANLSVDVTVSGYTPIGCIGFEGSGTTGIAFSDIYIANDNLYAYFINASPTSRSPSYFDFKILYVKN